MDRKERVAEAVRLRDSKWTLKRIAAELGVSVRTVWKMLDGHEKPQNFTSATIASERLPSDRLEVIGDSGLRSSGNVLWLCKCRCGRTTTATASNLRAGNKKSCGCMRRGPKRKKVES
jgi:predicted transcriptional regulator